MGTSTYMDAYVATSTALAQTVASTLFTAIINFIASVIPWIIGIALIGFGLAWAFSLLRR